MLNRVVVKRDQDFRSKGLQENYRDYKILYCLFGVIYRRDCYLLHMSLRV